MREHLKMLRLERNMKVSDMAKVLGWRRERYSKFENGHNILMSVNDMNTIFNYFGITMVRLDKY